MSDEQRKDDEVEVEAHSGTADVSDEPIDDGDSDFDAHIQRLPSVRMDSPSST